MLPLRPQCHCDMVSLQTALGLDDLKETSNRGNGLTWIEKIDKCQSLSHSAMSKTRVEIDKPLLGA